MRTVLLSFLATIDFLVGFQRRPIRSTNYNLATPDDDCTLHLARVFVYILLSSARAASHEDLHIHSNDFVNDFIGLSN